MLKNRFRSLLVVAILFRIIFSFLTWHPDVNNHVDWGIRIWEYGFKGFYDPNSNIWSYTWPNQPPGTIYIYAGIKKLYDFIYSVFWWINVNVSIFPSNIIFSIERSLFPALLKLPAILADFGIAYLIYRSVKSEKRARFAVLLWLLNPVIWYNSSVWGQTDSVIAFFAFLSFYLLSKNKPVLSVLSYAVSIYIKASLLIFIPVYLLLFLRRKYTIKTYIKSFTISFLTIVFMTLPFSKGNPVVWLYYLYQGKIFVQQLQVITANAFNVWATIASIHEKPHTLMLGPLSYQSWGTILFAGSYLLLLRDFIKRKTGNILFILSLVAFSSFMFMTNMHERYLYPFFPFATVVIAQNRKLLPIFLSISVISFLNMYNFWWMPKIELIVNFLSFGDRLVPRVLGLIMFVLYVLLFKYFLRQKKAI